jgi:hypothetical protein
MGLIGMFSIVALVVAGVIVRLRERRRRPDDR